MTLPSDLELSLDALVRSIAVRKGTPIALFLGAGASVSSGIPSAQDCIAEWKRDIFLSKNPHLEDQFRELTVPSVLERIQRWLEQQGGYPAGGDAAEYGFYIERCFPISDDRRMFFQTKIASARPGAGYGMLALLAEKRRLESVWSTNFDGLPARAAVAANVPVYEVGLDSVDRLARVGIESGLLSVAMHGDYRYDQLRNTPSEIRDADARIRRHLGEHVRNRPLIVVGYSGRDESVMSTLEEAYKQSGTGALYWCGYTDAIPAKVEGLLRAARAAGRSAYFVAAQGFDDLLWRLCVQSLPAEDQKRVRELASTLRRGPARARFSLPSWPTTGFIKSNAFAVECPAEMFEIELSGWPTDKRAWAFLDEVTLGREVVVAPFRGKVLALGTIDDLKAAFGPRFKSIVRTPISGQELSFEDGVVGNLLRKALLRSMATAAGVESDGRKVLWERQPFEYYRAPDRKLGVHQAAICFLRRIGETMYLVVKPTLLITEPDGTRAAKELSQPIVMQKLGYQHNAEFNQIMRRWRKTLFDRGTGFEFPPKSAASFRFVLRKSPAFVTIRSQHGRPMPVPNEIAAHVRHEGFELPEPKLLFSTAEGQATVPEPHPIKGVINNKPYDYSLTLQGFASSVSVGVVCSTSHNNEAAKFFGRLQQRQSRQQSDLEYLMDFPGFQAMFHLPLDVPRPGELRWVAAAEPVGGGDVLAGARDLAANVVRAIEQLHTHGPSVIAVVIPERWEPWTKIDSEDVKFDLHDFVKAFCVQRGIATQFIRESTLIDPQVCRVMWWLSLALYAKSMRTPWVLKGLSDGTAFVGLGFSFDRHAPRGAQIILGCSHMYNARGEGMEYRLSKVENPIIRGKNPFMSEDDAARVGRTIQELYFKARGDLPRRVVIHKLTPFIDEERIGLLNGLRGVDAIDLIEINETPLRYVASKPLGGGKFDEDRWPVKRGTVVKLDDYTALVWVHGVAAAIDPHRKYFQGKRRIPAPLLIRRHAGDSDLITVAEEILALSKMDWNSFDMYRRLPATVHSSGEIARIGALLQRFGNLSYDYRLFI
jgi:hypothetical protein